MFMCVIGLRNLQMGAPAESSLAELLAFKSQMAEAVLNIRKKAKSFTVPEIRRILLRAVSVLVASPKVGHGVLLEILLIILTDGQ